MARRLRSIYGTVGRARMTRTADSIGEWNPPSPSCLLQHGSGHAGAVGVALGGCNVAERSGTRLCVVSRCVQGATNPAALQRSRATAVDRWRFRL